MKYRSFGKTDIKVSALGFGAMRLPVVDNDYGRINEDEAIKMIRFAIDHGVNYIDTAWTYHQENSEVVVGKALKDGYRERVKIATKSPVWLLEKKSDLDKFLEKQLKKLDSHFIDFYLMHALDAERWKKLLDLDLFQWIEKVKKEGKIKYIGFSFHDKFEIFKEIVDSYEWDFCQIQYNYLDTEYQAGKKGLQYAYNKGLGVVIMEPLRGGALAGQPPAEIAELMRKSNLQRSITDLGLQWLWNQKEVSVVLSGMSTMEQLKENINSADNSGTDILIEEELTFICIISEKMRGPVPCTRCSYCMPCPAGVDIPQNFFLYNEAVLFKKKEEKMKRYNELEGKAEKCVNCLKCEDICPQNITVSSELKEVSLYFKGEK
ncbi:MAG: aldo/keto reductase [Halanaerobiaceae bacterium]|nr:aldo/keto reductase [Halanaerobiaceae bacterium]